MPDIVNVTIIEHTDTISVSFVEATDDFRVFLAEAPAGPASVVPGPPGKSAYEVALDDGFVGTLQQWRLSLKGDPGSDASVTNANVNAAIATNPGATVDALTSVVPTADTSFILGPEDSGLIIYTTAATQINCQMPEEDPGDGWSCVIIQRGDGQVTFIQGEGNDIESFLGLRSTAGPGAHATLIRIAANTYMIGGNLS